METSQVQNVPISPTQKITDSDIKKLKLKRIYFIGLLVSSFVFSLVFLFFRNWLYDSLVYKMQEQNLDRFYLFFNIFDIIFIPLFIITNITIIILLLRNENNIEIAYFLDTGNQRGLTPGIKYGNFLLNIVIFILLLTTIFVVIYILGLGSIYGIGKLMYLAVIILCLAMFFTIYGGFTLKTSVLRNGDITPQKVYSEDNCRRAIGINVGKFLRMAAILTIFTLFFIALGNAR